MDEYIVCEKCKYNTSYILEFRRHAFICMKEDSDYYLCPTCYIDGCADGEKKEGQ